MIKARITVTLKTGVLDPQGKAIEHALSGLGFGGVGTVRQGKVFDVELSETDKAKAEADQAKAEATAAESKAAIVAECAKAYFSAFGTLFEGDDVGAQAEQVREQLKGITSECQAALGAA